MALLSRRWGNAKRADGDQKLVRYRPGPLPPFAQDQVPASLQRLEPVLGSAVDLKTQVISHWDAIGATVPLIHAKEHFKHFSPELHTHTLSEMVHRMDL